MDNLRRVACGLEPIPRRRTPTDKEIADELAGTGLLEGYRPGTERQATLDEF